MPLKNWFHLRFDSVLGVYCIPFKYYTCQTMLSAIHTFSYSCIRTVCRCRLNFSAPVVSHRWSSTAGNTGTGSTNDNDIVSEKFVNRNPRNLEFMGIAQKRKGWRFQYPTRQFYHRLLFEKTNRNTTARVEHADGSTVVSASTKEFAIAKHLYSYTDVSAAQNIGRVIAQRCCEAGITAMILEAPEHGDKSDKLQQFVSAVQAGGVDLEEPDEVEVEYTPGIDYDDAAAVADLTRRQNMVADLCPLTRLALSMRKPKRGRRPVSDTIAEWRFRKREDPPGGATEPAADS